MLSPSSNVEETFVYEPHPSNPNLRIKKKSSLIDAKTDVSTKKVKVDDEKEMVVRDPDVIKVETLLKELLEDTLQPLYKVMSYLRVEGGSKLYYRYGGGELSAEQRKIPLVWNTPNMETFYRENRHLGPAILAAIADYLVPKKTDDNSPDKPSSSPPMRTKNHILFNETGCLIGALTQNQKKEILKKKLGETNPLVNADAKHWIWQQLENQIFLFLLDELPYGALDMAAKELGYPLKLLIQSDNEVTARFAQFCAVKFIKPKKNGSATGVQGGQVEYRISSGFYSTREQERWLIATKMWFKHVYKTRRKVEYPTLIDTPDSLRNHVDYMMKRNLEKNSEIETSINEFKKRTLSTLQTNNLTSEMIQYINTQSWLSKEFIDLVEKQRTQFNRLLDFDLNELKTIYTLAERRKMKFDSDMVKIKFLRERADALEPEILVKSSF